MLAPLYICWFQESRFDLGRITGRGHSEVRPNELVRVGDLDLVIQLGGQSRDFVVVYAELGHGSDWMI